MRDFRKYEIWQVSMGLVREVYSLTDSFPPKENFRLTQQTTRSAVSIPSNIAEGASRKSEKDFSRFLEISLGSLFELETQLQIAFEQNYIAEPVFKRVLTVVQLLERQTSALIIKLRN